MQLTSIASLRHAQDIQTFKQAAVDFGRAHGFEACFIISPVARNTRQGRILNNFGFDARWARAYRRCLHRIDPFPEIAYSHGAPFRIAEAGKLMKLTKAEQRYVAILERCGMDDLIVFPTFGSGARSAIMGYGHNSQPGSLSELDVLQLHMQLQAAYFEFCRMRSRQETLANELSIREKDVLFWLTQGKSNSTIAQILEISPATVDTYLRRIFHKLNVNDRVGAAMAAVQFGYVIPGEYRRAG